MTKSRDVTNMDAMPTHTKSWNITLLCATHPVTQQVENRKSKLTHLGGSNVKYGTIPLAHHAFILFYIFVADLSAA